MGCYWTHHGHSAINFAVMQRHSYREVIGCDPRAEGAHEKARDHHSARRHSGRVAARGTGAAAGKDAADPCADGHSRARVESTGPYRGLPRRSSLAEMT